MTFSLVHAHLICCASFGGIFENLISRVSVATCFGCDGIFNDSFIFFSFYLFICRQQ